MMDLQIVSDRGEWHWATTTCSYAYEWLLGHTSGTPYHEGFRVLERDFRIPFEGVNQLCVLLEKDVRILLRRVTDQPASDVPISHQMVHDVLGNRVRVYPLMPLHGRLMELHGLYEAMAQLVASRRDSLVFLLPRLESLHVRLIQLVAASTVRLYRSNVAEHVIAEYKRLVMNSSLGQLFDEQCRSDVRRLGEGGTVDDMVDFLVHWDLVREEEATGQLRATRKLEWMRI